MLDFQSYYVLIHVTRSDLTSVKMPRKKQGPRRLDEEEQRAGNFVMGGDVENNEEMNRELTERLASAPASEVNTIVQGVTGERMEEGEGSLYTEPVASSQSKMYSVIFDDDDDSYQSSEDEDFNPASEAKIKKKSPKKSPKKKSLYEKFPHIFPNAKTADAKALPVDKELEALVEDAEVIFIS